MKRLDRVDWVAAAAAVEVVTGIVLIIRPSLFGVLVFGAGFSPAGQALGRLSGFTLFALALACWPRPGAERKASIQALLLLSLLSAIYIIYLGVRRGLAGPLLWPAAALHAALSVMLILSWVIGSQSDRPTGEGSA
jgi:hypothetical protein